MVGLIDILNGSYTDMRSQAVTGVNVYLKTREVQSHPVDGW